MNSHDILMILVFTFPMFIFTILAGVYVSNYVDKNYTITEFTKRAIMLSVGYLFALVLATLLYYV